VDLSLKNACACIKGIPGLLMAVLMHVGFAPDLEAIVDPESAAHGWSVMRHTEHGIVLLFKHSVFVCFRVDLAFRKRLEVPRCRSLSLGCNGNALSIGIASATACDCSDCQTTRFFSYILLSSVRLLLYGHPHSSLIAAIMWAARTSIGSCTASASKEQCESRQITPFNGEEANEWGQVQRHMRRPHCLPQQSHHWSAWLLHGCRSSFTVSVLNNGWHRPPSWHRGKEATREDFRGSWCLSPCLSQRRTLTVAMQQLLCVMDTGWRPQDGKPNTGRVKNQRAACTLNDPSAKWRWIGLSHNGCSRIAHLPNRSNWPSPQCKSLRRYSSFLRHVGEIFRSPIRLNFQGDPACQTKGNGEQAVCGVDWAVRCS
jgi:hypothetical protein